MLFREGFFSDYLMPKHATKKLSFPMLSLDILPLTDESLACYDAPLSDELRSYFFSSSIFSIGAIIIQSINLYGPVERLKMSEDTYSHLRLAIAS